MQPQNKDTLFLVTAPSGAGKDWLCQQLENKYNIPTVRSYATREKRHPAEDGYTFINFKDINKYFNQVLQGFFDVKTKNAYFATVELLEKTFGENQFATLVVTPQSVIPTRRALKDSYKVVYIHIDTPEAIRIENMKARGDSDEDIYKRTNGMDVEIAEHYTTYKNDELNNLQEIGELEFLHYNCIDSGDALNIALRTVQLDSL